MAKVWKRKDEVDRQMDRKGLAGISDQIKDLEEELKKTKYNKATQHHIGLVKAKLARLKEKSQQRAASGGKGIGYGLKKTGDATVIIVGFPSAGKSTLLNKLTNAESKIGAYDFTTLTVVPGVMEYGCAKIQLLDVPGLIRGASGGVGRGKEVISVIRTADLIILIIDAFDINQLGVLRRELYDSGIRLDQRPPNVKIKKTSSGGIAIASTAKLTRISEETIRAVLREYKMNNCEMVIHEDIDVDQLIDVIESNKIYAPSIVVLNKIDLLDHDSVETAKAQIGNCVAVSADKEINLNILKEAIYRKFEFIRIYLKEVGKKPDMREPMIMKYGSSVKNVCERLHQDFLRKFRFCRVWGASAKFPGQRFKLDHVLDDKDVLELHVR